MPLSQCSASRFFAAFYRWNRITHRNYQSTCVAHFRRPDFVLSRRLALSRNFSTTRACALTEDVAQQAKEDRDQTVHDEMNEENPNSTKIGTQGLGKSHERGSISKLPMDNPDDGRIRDIHEQFIRQEEDSTSMQTETKRISTDVRRLMQCVPHPVVVITAAATMPKTRGPVPLGIAVSSFNTVTLDPPTISFNVKQPSQTLDAIRADRCRFRIHFFAASPGGAQLVDSFTKGNNPTAYNDRLKLTSMDFSGKSLNGKDHFSTAAHMRSKNISAIMECELTQELIVGDHIIAVATVSNVWTREKETKPYLSYVQHNYVQTPHNILEKVPINTKRS